MGRYRVRPGRFVIALTVMISLAVLVVWGAWSTLAWAKNTVLLNFLEVKFLTRDEIRKTTAVEGLVIRKEEPVKAPASGELRLLAQDGERLRLGAPLAQVRGVEEKTAWSPRAGVFCTHLDSLESVLIPGMIDVLDMGRVEKLSSSSSPQTATGEVAAGQIIGKVVDNLDPVLIYIRVDNPDRYAARLFDKGATVSLLCEGRELTGVITEARVTDNAVNMFVEVAEYPENFIHQRRVQLELVTRKITGWLVPVNAIAFKDGKPGIYVVHKQIVRWVPVTARNRLNDKVVIGGDHLSESVRYVNNPGWAREGARLDL
ncbi:HlyD family efflux transporter periplasmic adaptor subunit [Desulfoscipio geothermicus]|uniref:Putative membrane fusion protein n=1 Tax=Desulfoscipio geothermicus DSM 3669 TaxID=1121426 RepID=A0A1I6E9P3_9FIRM|nr:HlyD family efflux transporter periplasmic adaptor subunit [Desulfoscipio geothermicus]SFR14436.1 putative membrane fusion protein [Desulfoscipio geothermicus DSM 3669]